MSGEAVDEVVLAPVGLIGNHHNIPTRRQHGVVVPFFFGEELLDGREDHAARLNGELRPEIRSALSLHRRLTEQILAAGKRPEELIVQVIPIREYHEGGVLHRRFADDPPGVKLIFNTSSKTLQQF